MQDFPAESVLLMHNNIHGNTYDFQQHLIMNIEVKSTTHRIRCNSTSSSRCHKVLDACRMVAYLPHSPAKRAKKAKLIDLDAEAPLRLLRLPSYWHSLYG